MANNAPPAKGATLDPSAPEFTMPAEKTTESQPITNGTKKPEATNASAATTTKPPAGDAASDAKLTPAQLKKKKAAEKAARRAEVVAAKGTDAAAPAAATTQQTTTAQTSQAGKSQQQRRPSVGSKQNSTTTAGESSSQAQSHHKRTASSSGKALPIRPTATHAPSMATFTTSKSSPHSLSLTSHLRASHDSLPTLTSAGREIHPAILSLSLQLRDYVICGANARCVALLLAFKKVIASYSTPANMALSRHLTTHLSHQISYINHARPLGVSQGNAIRWLKKLVSTIDVGVKDEDAKSFLCQAIDQFIREKIVLADEVIARDASNRIEDGDVVLTYGKSSAVQKSLVEAHEKGKQFKVVVVDARPMFEGKNQARNLVREGVKVSYCLLASLADYLGEVTKCMLGAAAMLGNGRVSARVGTAVVAMMVNEAAGEGKRIPVMVLSESVKFTGKVALDSLMLNELGDPDALVLNKAPSTLTTPPAPPSADKGGKGGGGGGGGKKGGDKGKASSSSAAAAEAEKEKEKEDRKGLEGWKEQQGLHLLNLMYDVTPAEYIDVVISEQGALPPSAVGGVLRVSGGDE